MRQNETKKKKNEQNKRKKKQNKNERFEEATQHSYTAKYFKMFNILKISLFSLSKQID